MKRSTEHVIPPIIKYGIQIDKNAKLVIFLIINIIGRFSFVNRTLGKSK